MIGDLCYKSGGSALAFEYGLGSSLIYKSEPLATDAIRLSAIFDPAVWVCDTYDQSHDGIMKIHTLWNGGSTFKVGSGAASFDIPGAAYDITTTSLEFDMCADDLCAAHEDPHITVTFRAIQNGRTVFSDLLQCPMYPQTRRISINFTAGVIQSITAGGMPT